MQRLKVLILFGGISEEHEVSISSANSIFEAIDKNLFFPASIGITKLGKFIPNVNPATLIPKRQSVSSDSQTWSNQEDVWQGTNWLDMIIEADVIFPVLHGPGGEDGTIQGLCELLGKNYVGSKVTGSAICMDKAITKDLLKNAGIKSIPYFYFNQSDWRNKNAQLISQANTLKYPLFVKPTCLGSSVGISKVSNENELITAINTAFKHGDRVLIEQGIDGREIECSILGNNDLSISVPGEIKPNADFYDYETKYINNNADLIIPADLSPAISTEVQNLSMKAFKILQCRGLARVDFFVEYLTDDVYLNEINTMPGFTPISMYPKLWQHEGVSYSELITKLINLALEE